MKEKKIVKLSFLFIFLAANYLFFASIARGVDNSAASPFLTLEGHDIGITTNAPAQITTGSSGTSSSTSGSTSTAVAVVKPVKGVVRVSTSLNIRTGPWGKIIGSFHNNDQVQIIGKVGEWYKITWNGKTVYCHSDYITVDSATASTIPVSSSGTSTGPSTGTSPGDPGKVITSNGGSRLEVPKLCQMTTNCPAPGSACGPTALAMILSYYNAQSTSAMVTRLWNVCGSTKASGTSREGLVTGARSYGFPNAEWFTGKGLSWIQEQIKAGKPILAYVTHHYVVIKGFDANGNVIINDPGRSVVERVMPFNQFAGWWNGGGLNHAAMVLK
ncbi:MAG: C39 family peptidase [Candidatus Riflebacteria bacterium]|nr:C39 family peptidase [Candidatus Riflebacteria bacterium]